MAWVDDLVTNTKNAIADAQKIGQTLMPAAPGTPLQPARTFPALGGMSTATLMILAAVVIGGVILWKKA